MWPSDGAKLVRRSLQVRLSEGEEVGQVMAKYMGQFIQSFGGGFCTTEDLQPLDSSPHLFEAEAEFTVLNPYPTVPQWVPFGGLGTFLWILIPFLASPDALEAMGVSKLLIVSIDFSDVTLVSEDTQCSQVARL